MTESNLKKAEKLGFHLFDNPKIQAKKTLNSWKFKLLSWIITLSFLTYTFISGLMIINEWFKVNEFVFVPLKVQYPYIYVHKKPILSPVIITKSIDSTVEEKKIAKINDLYRKVRFIESNAGMSKNDTGTHAYCQSIGMVNELGWFPNGNKKFCFKDYNEQFTTFKNWWMKALDNGTVDENLCIWNTGISQPQCRYSQEVNSLN